jgi:hypothetical protein
MQGKRYRLKTPTLTVLDQDGHRLPVMVPANSIVQVTAGRLDGNRLVDVEWEGKTLMMFTIDLRERGELVKGAVAKH